MFLAVVGEYRARNDVCVEASLATLSSQMQESQDRTIFYNEKLQQMKAKKSTKRQRDSSRDGPVSKVRVMVRVSFRPWSSQKLVKIDALN